MCCLDVENVLVLVLAQAPLPLTASLSLSGCEVSLAFKCGSGLATCLDVGKREAGGWGGGSVVRCLSGKHGDLSSHPQHTHRVSNIICSYNSRAAAEAMSPLELLGQLAKPISEVQLQGETLSPEIKWRSR